MRKQQGVGRFKTSFSEMNRNKILRDTLSYISTNYTVQVLSFVRAIIVARLLSPLLYGYFSGLGLLLLYNPYAQLGVLQGMFREMSIKRGEGHFDELDRLKDNAFSFIVCAAVVVFLSVLGYSVIYAEKLGPEITWGLRAFALICVLSHQEMLYHDLFRLEHRFSEINLSRLIFSISNICLSIGFIMIWGFYGVLAAFMVSTVLANAYLTVKGRYRFRIQFEKETLLRFLRAGLPIALCLLTMIIMNSIDRFMIIKFLTAEELGFYAVALGFTMLLFKFAEAVSYVAQPRILEHYGKHDRNGVSLIDIYEKCTLVLATTMAIFTGIFVIIVEPTIEHLLPKYQSAIGVSQILIVGVFFFSANQIALRVIMAIGNFGALIVVQAVTAFINVLLNYCAIVHGFGLRGVACATAISYFMYSAVSIQFVYRQLSVPPITGIVRNVKTFMPVCVAGAISYLLSEWDLLILFMNEALIYEVISYAAKIGILVLCFLPYVLALERKTGVFLLLKETLARR